MVRLPIVLRTLAGLAAGLGLFVLACELLCRVLPVSSSSATGYTVDPLILTYPPHYRFRSSTGWDLRDAQTLVTNNLGFATRREFVPDPRAVALIGDSYVEALMLDESDRPAEQLQRRLAPQRPVYGMGRGGTGLLDYAERVRLAHDKLAVQDFVLLVVAGDVRESLCGSGNVHGPCLQPDTLAPATDLRPPPSPIKALVRESAFAQYLFSQLKVEPARLGPALRALPATMIPGHATHAASGSAVLAAEREPGQVALDTVTRVFFERLAAHVQGRLVLLVYNPPSGQVTEGRREEAVRFMAAARSQGATVVEVQPLLSAHEAHSKQSLSMGPHDRHLNAIGQGLLMQAAAQALASAPRWAEVRPAPPARRP